MVLRGYFKGIESIILENDVLRATYLPEYGSKLASLILKETNKEFMFQTHLKELVIPEYSSPFSEYDSSGFDEVFPSIDKCFYPNGERKGVEIPDHGEVWALPWNFEIIDEEKVKFWVVSPTLSYRFEKIIELVNNKIKTIYTIYNLSEEEEFEFIWTPHALLSCDENVQLNVPSHLNKIMTVEHSTEHLGEWGTIHNYPETISHKTGKMIDMSKVEKVEANNCEKFYFLEKLRENDVVSLKYQTGEEICYEYDTNKVPYLGVWKTQGGYRGDYNIAIEPCTGIYDDLYVASKIRKVSKVEKAETFSWNFNIIIKK